MGRRHAVRLGPIARALIESDNNKKIVSVVSLWEISLKVRVGKLEADVAAISTAIAADGFRLMEIATIHSLSLRNLPLHAAHKDPFDHLIIATAQAERANVMTSDAEFKRYSVTLVDASK